MLRNGLLKALIKDSLCKEISYQQLNENVPSYFLMLTKVACLVQSSR